MATAVLWAYVCSGFWYPTWYIVTVIACAVMAILAATGRLDFRGVVRATIPVAGYFALLLLTAAWAEYPRETLRWLIVDSIQIAVFVLFFLAGRNSGRRAIAAAMATIVIPAIALGAFEYHHDPFAARHAGYSFSLLPLLVAFSAAGATMSRRRWPYLLAVSLAFAFLLIGRSRTPLAALLFAVALSVIAFGKGPRDSIRKGAAAIAAAVAIALLVAAIPVARPMMMTTLARVTRELPQTAAHARLQQESGGYGRHVRPRKQVSVRTHISALSGRLARQSFPAGIGYMNFQMHFEKQHGYRAALHSMYSAWLVEGGLAVAIYVAVCGSIFVTRLWKRARSVGGDDERAYAEAIMIGLGAMLLIGAFHQIHQSPALWLLLGLGRGIGDTDWQS